MDKKTFITYMAALPLLATSILPITAQAKTITKPVNSMSTTLGNFTTKNVNKTTAGSLAVIVPGGDADTLKLDNSLAMTKPVDNALFIPDSSTRSTVRLASWTDWANWRNWIGRWVQFAEEKISRIGNYWQRMVVLQGLRMAISGASEAAITHYYRSQGQYCPDRPWWLPLPAQYAPAWPVLTCAEAAGG